MDIRSVRVWKWVSPVLAALVLAVVATVLSGYLFGTLRFIRLFPSLQGMSLLTALSLGGIAFALAGQTRVGRGVLLFALWSSLIIAIVALAEHALLGADVLSPRLAHQLFGLPTVKSGRTSIATALSLALLALGLLHRLHARPIVCDYCAGAVLLVSGTALLGYAYGVRDLYSLFPFNTIALHTAGALFLLGIATLLSQTERGWARAITSAGPGGRTTRALLAFTLLPPVVGALLLHLTHTWRLGPDVAMAILVIVSVAPLTVSILHGGKILEDLEEERRSKDILTARVAEHLNRQLAAQAIELRRESEERARTEAIAYGVQRLEAIGQLTGGIAHDFNNLLMGVSMNLHLSKSQLPGDHPVQVYLGSALAAARRGTKLSGQLLAFSRTQRLDVQPMELDASLAGMRELLDNALGSSIFVDIRPDANHAWVLADADQLNLAVVNLALNARDAMPEGGIFAVTTADHVTETVNGEIRSYVALRVRDTGQGMSADIASRATEPFFTTKPQGKGSGLGLAQVYGVVKQCGGELRIDSEIGKGTTVEILLPRTEPPAQPVACGAAERAIFACPMPISRSVLLIDDDEHVRMAVAEMFKCEGYEVTEAENGTIGLQLLETMTPAIAVIDFIMPGLNGAEVARLARVKLPKLPIIFVSGYSDTLALDKISGAVVLRKPIPAETLLAAVETAIGR
ncbi:response regulator [Robbsia sp. Bb-Pol-6]|uniref:histidine kinase n=1 Tax=Robbsia betulipollinis TaxID=2981849 RepID=A0ABT3ZJQ4_9BURK|nr:ATP-binding protein [Robbsia betulipollinis]MCY0386769.1 response regulator [Robbsia betulipollinis]